MAKRSPDRKSASKLNPTRATATRARSGESLRRPSVEAIIRRARGSLPAALFRRFIDADLLTQSAALALYAMLSLAPLLLILIWLTSGLLPGAEEALMRQVGQLVGTEAELVARTIVVNAKRQSDGGSVAGWGSLGLLFVAATTVFAQLQDALNQIFRTDAAALSGVLAWLRKRVFSLGLVFALGFLLLVSMTVNTALQLVFNHVEWMLPAVASVVTWIVYAISFALMYHYLPDRRVGWHRALVGGATTALLFQLGRASIGWYIGGSNPASASAYGSMGAMVLALVWIYYTALIVFIGAALTAVVDERAQAQKKGE